MKPALRGLLLAAAGAAALSVSAAAQTPFDQAVTAYQRGDYATALRLWRPIAEQGGATAQFNLGLMYDNGEGVPENDTEAVRWYRLAAEQGYPDAQNNLGLMYDSGEGVSEDDVEAVRWYRLAAEQGYADAQSNLGVKYAKGEGVPLMQRDNQDETRATNRMRTLRGGNVGRA